MLQWMRCVLGSLTIAFAVVVSTALPAAALQPQQGLTIISVAGVLNTPLTLVTSGGSGTGSVTFSVTAGTATGCTVNGATLTSTTSGTCVVTATKASDSTYDVISSNPTNVTLAANSSTTTLGTSSTQPQNVGTPLTFTATISQVGTLVPSGSVTFQLGAATISGCSAQVLSSGVATCTTTSLVFGTNTLTANYGGDTNYGPSTSSPLSFALLSPPSVPTGVTATLTNTSAVVTWSAATANGFPVLGYTVTASPGGRTCAVAAPHLSCSVPGISASSAVTFTVTATSAGGTSVGSTPTTAVSVSQSASSVSLSALPMSPQNLGVPVTITAVVTSGATGSVEFEVGGTPLPGCVSRTVALGIANCTTTSLVAGTAALTALYLGDANYSGSTSATLSFTISSTTLTVASSPLVITTLSGPFNATLALTTSGGSGAGAITFGAVNGTATGCSLSGVNLTVVDPGTCLVTATQVASGSYLGYSSNVTTVVMYSSYSATYGVVGSYYSCPSGGSLSGSTCTVTSSATISGYSCPSGGALSGSTCTISSTPSVSGSSCPSGGALSGSTCTIYYGATGTVVYSCPSGWSGPSGSSCYRYTKTGTPFPSSCTNNGGTAIGTVNSNPNCELFTAANSSIVYTCPSGGTLSGTACITSTYQATPPVTSCPGGGTYNGTTCVISTYNATPAYSCSSGTPSGAYCLTTYSATYTSYYGYICTVGGSLSGTNCSLTSSSSPSAVPGAPTGVTATSGNTSSLLTWIAPASSGNSSVISYTVASLDATTTANGGQTCTTSFASSCTVSGLTDGDSYSFTVIATNGSGNSLPSTPSNQVVPATVPGVATGVTAVAGNTQATVSWTAPSSNGGAPITGYTVTSTSGAFTCSTTSATSCAVTGLTGGVSYAFSVTAMNAAGTGPSSATSTAVIPTGPPSAPVGVTATAGNAQATVTWSTPSSSGSSVITGYTVTSSPGGVTCTTTGALTCVVTGLTNGTPFTFTVTATNVAGTGPTSLASTAVTPTAITAPVAPTAVTASAGHAQATVSWTAPASNGGSPITGYTVTSLPGGFTCATSSATSCTVTGLTGGSPYTFSVTAINVFGTGPASSPSPSVTPMNALPSVSGGTLSSDATYYYRTFLASGAITVNGGSLSLDMLIIGGGGGGGGGSPYGVGGGGGAGGVEYLASQNMNSGSYAVAVGSGGLANTTGGNSSITGFVAAVGGGFGGGGNGISGGIGGSGGGGGGSGGYGYGGSAGTSGQGYGGGWAQGGAWAAGGGGGAGGVGQSASSTVGTGGIGTYAYSTWASATSTGVGGYYAGGGGGSAQPSWNGGLGYSGGSGGGGAGSAGATATNGLPNTGGGGGGCYMGASTGPGIGGSGIVIIRYTRASVGG
jgi:hypothetical protein